MIDHLPDPIIEATLGYLRSVQLSRAAVVCKAMHTAARHAVVLSAMRRWRTARPGLEMAGLVDLEMQHHRAPRLVSRLIVDDDLEQLVDDFKALDKAVVAVQAHKLSAMAVSTLIDPEMSPPVRRAALRLLKSLPGWGTRRHAAVMLRYVEDEDQHVRNAACRALPFARLGAEWVAQHQATLVRARIKNDALQQVIDALAMLEPTALARHEQAILRHADDKHECVRDAVARAVAKVAGWRATVDLPPVDAESSPQLQVS